MDSIIHPGTLLIAGLIFGVLSIWVSVRASDIQDRYSSDIRKELLEVRDNAMIVGVLLFFIAMIWQAVRVYLL